MEKLLMPDWLAIVSAIGVVVALLGNLIGMGDRGRKRAERDAIMHEDVKHIRTQVDKNDALMGAIDSKLDGIDKRLVVVEQSTKSAHRRIDELTGKERK